MILVMPLFAVFVLSLLANHCVQGAVFHSCKDIYTNDHHSKNGTYTIHNRENKPYQVYCEFYYKYGYTFISRQASVDINISDLFTTTDHVKVRHIAGNGSQTETILENIESHKNLSLGLFYNRHIGYAMPINIEHLAPYLYVGFLPVSVASHTTIQGYRAAKQNVLFQNCDSNPNSYFVFYFNPKQTANEGYGSGWAPSAFMTEWMVLGSAITAENAMPPEFFFDYEIHFGGCGGYMFHHRLDNKEGAALGLRFDEYDPCVCSPCQNGGSCRSPSDTRFICHCAAGYTGDTCGDPVLSVG